MQAVTLEMILRAVFGVQEGERLERLRAELRAAARLVTDPRRAIFVIALGPSGSATLRARSGGTSSRSTR